MMDNYHLIIKGLLDAIDEDTAAAEFLAVAFLSWHQDDGRIPINLYDYARLSKREQALFMLVIGMKKDSDSLEAFKLVEQYIKNRFKPAEKSVESGLSKG